MTLNSAARFAFLFALPACVSQVPLENLPCPCAAGWTCCSDQDVCVRAGASCANTALAVTPPSAHVRFGGTLALSASEPVSWSLDEGASAGSIAPDGTYTAPLARGPFHVVATSVARPDNQVRVEVTVGPTHLDLLAGHIGGFGNADGLGTEARFGSLGDVVGDGRSTLFIVDAGNWAIRKIDTASGSVTTLARFPHVYGRIKHLAYDSRSGLLALVEGYGSGNEDQLFAIDPGTGVTHPSDAVLQHDRHSPSTGLALDGEYVYELDDRRIFRRPLAGGAWQVVAGALAAGVDDGMGTAARFVALQDITPDGHGGFRLLDCLSYTLPAPFPDTCALRSYDPASSAVTTIRSLHDSWGNLLHGLHALATDQDHDFLMIGKALWDGTATTQLASWSADSVDAPASSQDAIWAQANQVYVSDAANAIIRRNGPLPFGTPGPGTALTTFAGMRPYQGSIDGGSTDARFSDPRVLAEDGLGGLLLLDNGWLRHVDAEGTVASVGTWQLDGLVVDHGRYLFSSSQTHSVNMYDPLTRTGSVLAGDAMFHPGNRDGVGYAAAFNKPSGLAADGMGNLYVADTGNGAVRRLAIASATVSTIATGFAAPLAVAAGDGEVFVAEEAALWRVRLSSGEVKKLSGADDGGWKQISAIVYDPAGILYVSDTADARVRAVIVASGEVFDVVGKPRVAGVRLAPLPAAVNTPSGLALLPSGALAISSAAESAILVAR